MNNHSKLVITHIIIVNLSFEEKNIRCFDFAFFLKIQLHV